MRGFIATLVDNSIGVYFANFKDSIISLQNSSHKSVPKFCTQHNNDKYWDKRACGIACVKMVLDYHGNNTNLANLIKTGLDYKGYDVENDIGWYHLVLVKLLERHGVFSSVKKYVSSKEIAKHISNHNFVIASIESKSDGHLILVYDYELDENNNLRQLIYHDPWYKKNGASKKISIKNFDKISKRRVIIVNTQR